MKRTLPVVVATALFIATAVAGQTKVYVTEHGKKYHLKNCRLKHGSKGILLSEAKKKGYTPCGTCKPPTT